MKVLILGADGMLGHRILTDLQGSGLTVAGTVRKDNSLKYAGKFNVEDYQIYYGIDAENLTSVENTISDFRPQYVINCIGFIKQRDRSQVSRMIYMNALFPHLVADICERNDARLFLMSTDCVFSGEKGSYRIQDQPDAQDVYGISKKLGEIDNSNTLTLRTSIIGHEIFNSDSLLEWFLKQTGSISGYKRAIFSGFTTNEMAKIIKEIIVQNRFKGGVYQVSSFPISKYDLLLIIRDIYQVQVNISEDYTFKCDRSLESKEFRKDFGYEPPTWPSMIEQMAKIEDRK